MKLRRSRTLGKLTPALLPEWGPNIVFGHAYPFNMHRAGAPGFTATFGSVWFQKLPALSGVKFLQYKNDQKLVQQL